MLPKLHLALLVVIASSQGSRVKVRISTYGGLSVYSGAKGLLNESSIQLLLSK